MSVRTISPEKVRMHRAYTQPIASVTLTRALSYTSP
eukprot:COSAG05_NODE_13443_length_430_cov_0.743202_2_plen_35_part_01